MCARITALLLAFAVGPALAAEEPPRDDVAPSAAATSLDGPDQAKPAAKKKRKRKQARVADEPKPLAAPDLDARGSISAGATDGRGTRRAPHAFVESDVAITPKLDLWVFGFELAARVTHTHAVLAPLQETDAQIDVEAGLTEWKLLRVYVDAGVETVARPGWLDPYQPTSDGRLLPTDRFGSLERRVGARLTSTPLSKHHARASYRYAIVDSVRDAAFDPVLRPNHLTPQDHDAHELVAGWRFAGDGLKLGVATRAFRRSWFYVFARDAGTGKTHAQAGGAPPNPLQVLQGVELEPQVELRLLAGKLELEIEPSIGVVDDPFQGYLSSLDLGCAVAVTAHLPLKLRADARLASTLRLYGDDAYTAGPKHPALDFGDRRQDARATAALALHRALGGGVDLYAELKAISRRTNFPDYVPGQLPQDQLYDVRRDYVHASVQAGIAFEL